MTASEAWQPPSILEFQHSLSLEGEGMGEGVPLPSSPQRGEGLTGNREIAASLKLLAISAPKGREAFPCYPAPGFPPVAGMTWGGGNNVQQ